MFKLRSLKRVTLALLVFALTACAPAPVAAPSPTAGVATTPPATLGPATASPAASPGAVALPTIPAPVAVTLDSKATALAVLDVNTSSCAPRPPCVDTLPTLAALIKKARDAKVSVIFSTTAATNTILPQVAPQPGEPVVVPSVADKFFNTNFDDLLKQRKATTLIVVGTAANGAVLYTSYGANVRGYTVVVAEDGISSAVPFSTVLARFQLLNQPGFTNTDNKPLADKLVTLSRGDLITFK